MSVLALAAQASGSALAFDLVPGGYAAPVDSAWIDPVRRDIVDDAAGDGPGGLALDFTPRSSTGVVTLEGAEQEGGRLSFDLVISSAPTLAADRLGLGASAAAGRPVQPQRGGGLAVGGAMRWSDWTLGGTYGRAAMLGADMDLMAAMVGYGRLNAQVAYAQAVDEKANPLDVLMLSTDLAAWSWLTLESDLALGADRATEESVAAGRVGIRLNF